jgi:hypothetical protein
MPKPVPGASAEKVALYEKVVATNPKIDRKGATMPYTSVNGNMFSVLAKDGTLALRLSDADRVAFVAKYKTRPVIMYGALLRECVEVPDPLLKKTAELKKWFDRSYTYTAALKPKATTRKPAAKKAKRTS